MGTKFNETDKMWICGCGSLNASWRETCGGCGKDKPKNFKTHPGTLDHE
jgi:hypothetical protein